MAVSSIEKRVAELPLNGRNAFQLMGKTVGGEFRMGKGPYFLWPPDLPV